MMMETEAEVLQGKPRDPQGCPPLPEGKSELVSFLKSQRYHVSTDFWLLASKT